MRLDLEHDANGNRKENRGKRNVKRDDNSEHRKLDRGERLAEKFGYNAYGVAQ